VRYPLEMRRARALGLRTQIVITLVVAFSISFPLLGVAAVRLTERARETDRIASAHSTARLLAASLSERRGSLREPFYRYARSIVGSGGVIGAELIRGDLLPYQIGQPGTGVSVEVPLATEGAVRLWIRPRPPGSSAPLTNMLLLYVALTAGSVVVLAFFFITFLIVRPLDSLTRASERIADGKLEARVPIKGGAELARLAVSFNRMAAQLEVDRDDLESQLAKLQETARELETAQKQVIRSAKLESVGRLSAGIAHEIGNPLSAILGLIEIAQSDETTTEDRNEFLHRIQMETERIHRIIAELLTFSRRDAELAPAPTLSPIDLKQVIDEVLILVSAHKQLRDVSIQVSERETLPHVNGNFDQFKQVILNLLLNAGDAMQGEGSIEIRSEPTEEEFFELHIEDQGTGIDEELLSTLFEPFVTTKAPGEGTGLGLSVCHTIMHRAGGSIEARNRPEGGAIFALRFRLS